MRAIVTDIEGTTSALAFVKDILFPFARQRLADFIRTQGTDSGVAQLLEDARAEAGGDLNQDALIAQLQSWMDEDRKITPLKTLQGLIWEEGYRNGELTGHVYADAVRALQSWKARGIHLYVYSSGSVQAQRLLFAHTEYGDLAPLFSGYFDTTIGHKREVGSYRAIAAAIAVPAQASLFLSDVVEELDAARLAGMQTIHVVREGALDAAAAHPQVRDFAAIAI